MGDAAEIVLETFVYAGSGGDDQGRAASELASVWPQPAPSQARVALSALGRHFTQLHRVAAAQAAGGPLGTERCGRSSPRPHFKREPAFLARQPAASGAAAPGAERCR